MCSNLAVIQVTEASDDFLLVELIGLELHPPDGLHGAVVLEALLAGQHRLHGRALLQTVNVAFLKRRTPKNITELHGHNPRRRERRRHELSVLARACDETCVNSRSYKQSSRVNCIFPIENKES